MSPAQTILEGVAIIVGSVVVLIVAFIAFVKIMAAICRWKMNRLWQQMTPEQRLAIRFKEMAEAVRNNRK